jgi:peptidoglycan/xylan/chitin deacetylase (PgdA/CDA1 family)
MDAVKARLLGAALILLAAASAVGEEPAAWTPKGERLEILQKWEKPPGAPPPAEIVAGIYERDCQKYDFDNQLAITIDDALPNKYLETTLDILKRRGIKATFFIIGSCFVDAAGKPRPRARELLGRIANEGHSIGSHSFWHRRMDLGGYRDNRKAIGAELDRNEAAINAVLGYRYPIRYFRPPNGAHSTPGYALDRLLRARGQYLANWTITSFDWCIRLKPGNPDRLGPEAVLARTLKQAREESGGVVLLHCFPSTVDILDKLLASLAAASNARGKLSFSSLDALMRLKYGTAESDRL